MSSPKWTAINKPAWTAVNTTPDSGPMTPATIAQKQLQSDCEVILAHGSDELYDNWLLKVAGVFTNAEIIEKTNQVGSKTPLTANLLTQRISTAIDHAAEQSGRPRKSVKEELEAARKANGVDLRTNEYKKEKRKEGVEKRKREKEAASADKAASDESEKEAEQDPLGDLEEMTRRADGGKS